jgi:hypothetical protein
MCTPFRITMPAKGKKFKSAVRDQRPSGATKDYVTNRWTIDAKFCLRVLVKADDHATSGLFFSIYGGAITGMWFVNRNLNRVATRFMVVTTNLGDRTTDDQRHEFNTHGVLLCPKLFKDFEVEDGKAAPALLGTLAAFAKIDKSETGTFSDSKHTREYKRLSGQDH